MKYKKANLIEDNSTDSVIEIIDIIKEDIITPEQAGASTILLGGALPIRASGNLKSLGWYLGHCEDEFWQIVIDSEGVCVLLKMKR